MKKTYFFNLLAIAVLSFTSCSKDGSVGPAGPAGSQGATGTAGAAGAVGATGADGTKIYSAAEAPAATLGATGDLYLNTATSDLYGPKTAAGWGTSYSLKGATGAAGAAGAAGSTIISGAAAPAAAAGVNGDYYLNTATYLFYGPKTGGTWPAPVSLKGPKGDTGTANVIYSDWITPPTYTKTTVFGTTTFTYNIPEPKITQDILDKGVVLVYGRLNGYVSTLWPTDQTAILPIIITYLQGTTPQIDTWSGFYSLGNVQINVKNNNNVYGGLSTAHSFRYVIIPGGVKVADYKDKTYNELKKEFNIQD